MNELTPKQLVELAANLRDVGVKRFAAFGCEVELHDFAVVTAVQPVPSPLEEAGAIAADREAREAEALAKSLEAELHSA